MTSADPNADPRGLRSELGRLFAGEIALADGIVPPLVFVTANALWGLMAGAILGVGSGVAITLWRLGRRRQLRFAVAGLAGSLFAALFALRAGTANAYFLPGIITGLATTAVVVISIVTKRPFVAWTSWFARGWPLDWYWHPRVRPAYSRASWLWAGFFLFRSLTQWWLYVEGDTVALGLARVVMGWPMLLGLLVVTYLLGRRWLRSLGGPSVAEFEAGAEPPWEGQSTGF
ncbi:MAG: hypothetical protein KatS3mg011_1038 [Acidimicrobiia bacterium]|nr:MAG: hypothetical protein KatS3mg011_1038 [Acidimicrobiia bacterium]